MHRFHLLPLAVFASFLVAPAHAQAGASPTRPTAFHRITVVDEQTSRGIPGVELKIPDSRHFYTDSAGVVAFCEPDLMGKTVFFSLKSFGYLYPANFIGQRGRALLTTPGSSSTLVMRRVNIAQRLYRVTGSGIYRDSMLLGDTVPPTQDDTLTPVTGMDSVQSSVYKGKMYWFWGDTSMSSNPLGNFQTTGATSDLPTSGGLDPDLGVGLSYFRKGSHVRPMFNDKHRPIWVGGVCTLRDAQGGEHLFTNYAKVDQAMKCLERGLAEFDDQAGQFRITTVYPLDAVLAPDGHVFPHEENGTSYLYYANPWPCVRRPATVEAMKDLSTLEAFTCFKPGTRFSGNADQLERDKDGKLVWGWKKNTSAMNGESMKLLTEKKLIRPEEALWSLHDTNTTASIAPHAGSVYYNAHRKRWVSIRCEVFGAGSMLGETWYFEADTPLGPWVYGQKIVTHRAGEQTIDTLTWSKTKVDTYSFYNPLQHPEFDKDGGRTIYFEGTYTSSFAGDGVFATPGYDYNQIMYKLDLEDPRLFLPVAVYRVEGGKDASYCTKLEIPEKHTSSKVAFFAPDRPRKGCVPVYEIKDGAANAVRLSLTPPEGDADPASTARVFYAVAPEEKVAADSPTVALYEFKNAQGQCVYSTDPGLHQEGYTRAEKPLCRVWPNPLGAGAF